MACAQYAQMLSMELFLNTDLEIYFNLNEIQPQTRCLAFENCIVDYSHF